MISEGASKAITGTLLAGLLGYAWWRDHAEPEARAAAQLGFHLREVSHEVGIDFRHAPARFDPRIANIADHVAGLGASVSIVDANGDGREDVFTTSSADGAPNALFLNLGDGRFRDVAAEAGLAESNRAGEGASMAGFWGDYDNDGDEDLYLARYGYPQLFRNDGGAHFTDVTEEAGLHRWRNENGAVWLDYDRDGWLDLYVGGYFRDDVNLWQLASTRIMQESFEFAKNGGHNLLYRNRGDGTFEDVTERTGTDSTRWTMAIASADFDGNGWPDLYLANDYGPEELFLNKEGKRFELLTGAGLEQDSKSGMCVALGDVRNEGRLAVYVTNISQHGYLFQGNNLRLNRLRPDGRGLFDEIAQGPVANCGWAWGAQFGDLNDDGWQDLYVANGFISNDPDLDYWYDMGKIAIGAGNIFEDATRWPEIGKKSLSGHQRSRLLLSSNGIAFEDVAEAAGVTDTFDGRAVAMADLFDRGALDVLVANQRGPLLVYKNEVSPPRHWIQLRLVGTKSNRSAIGAEATLYAPGMQQVQVVQGASGFSAQNQRRLHFGLGDVAKIERVVIRWPSGGETTLDAPAVDQLHVVREEN